MEGWDGGTNRSMFPRHTWLLYGKVRGFGTQSVMNEVKACVICEGRTEKHFLGPLGYL